MVFIAFYVRKRIHRPENVCIYAVESASTSPVSDEWMTWLIKYNRSLAINQACGSSVVCANTCMLCERMMCCCLCDIALHSGRRFSYKWIQLTTAQLKHMGILCFHIWLFFILELLFIDVHYHLYKYFRYDLFGLTFTCVLHRFYFMFFFAYFQFKYLVRSSFRVYKSKKMTWNIQKHSFLFLLFLLRIPKVFFAWSFCSIVHLNLFNRTCFVFNFFLRI